MAINDITTQQNDTREIVKEAREKVGLLRDEEGLTPKQMNLVDSAYTALVDTEDLLVLKNLKASVKKLQGCADKLKEINSSLKKSIEKLKNISKYLDKAATAIGALADIVAKASGAGIL